jgi:hypothetical protein
MRMKALLSVGCIVCGFLFFLYGCGAGGASTPTTPYNELDVYDINVQVHTVPQVNIPQPFQIKAIIFSLYPIATLTGVFTNPGHKPRSGTLEALLRPPSSYKSKKYALCMDVALELDDPSAFSVDENTTPSIQELTLISDVSQPNSTSPKYLTATWNVRPLDPGIAEVDHVIGVDVAFTSQAFCGDNKPPLLGTAYHLVKSEHNIVKAAALQVINPELRFEKEFVDARKTIIAATIPALTTAILGWISGLIPWIVRLVGSSFSRESVQNHPPPSAPAPNQKVSGWRAGCGIIGITIGPFILIAGLLSLLFGPASIAAFTTSVIVACVGSASIIAAVWLIKNQKVAAAEQEAAPRVSSHTPPPVTGKKRKKRR